MCRATGPRLFAQSILTVWPTDWTQASVAKSKTSPAKQGKLLAPQAFLPANEMESQLIELMMLRSNGGVYFVMMGYQQHGETNTWERRPVCVPVCRCTGVQVCVCARICRCTVCIVVDPSTMYVVYWPPRARACLNVGTLFPAGERWKTNQWEGLGLEQMS